MMLPLVAILYFTDGLEAKASEATALDMYKILDREDAKLYPLSSKTFYFDILKIPKGSICLLATHGGEGENGALQSYLSSLGFKYTHSHQSVCAVLSDKHITKLIYRALNIPTPDWVFNYTVFNFNNQSNNGDKYILYKPRFGGSKIGIKKMLKDEAINLVDGYNETIIEGRFEVGVSVLRDKKRILALEPITRLRNQNHFGVLEETEEKLDNNVIEKCKKYALHFFQVLDCYGVTKTDFLIDESNSIWAIETDAIPGLSMSNATSIAASRSGLSYKNLISKVLTITY